MSGIEAVGLILAVVPLVISALEGYKEGRNPIKTFAWKWRFELESLIRCLKEQRWFFRNSVQVLLQAATINEEVTAGIDPAVLLARPEIRNQLATYLQDGETLKFFDGVVKGYKASLESLIQRLGHIKKGCSATESISAVLDSNISENGTFNFDKRFEFTMKHKEMRGHIENLDTCNDKLKKLIDRIDAVNQTKRKYLTREHAARQLASALQKVRHHAIALHVAIDACWNVTDVYPVTHI